MVVVICLKNRTFAVSQTSELVVQMPKLRLWFAWKIVLLQYHKHRAVNMCRWDKCCDLLEKSYFCSITNIDWLIVDIRHHVVICLKNRTFAVSQTSGQSLESKNLSLWFAWKIVLLQYHKHLLWPPKRPMVCCDLLEKSYFCSITNIICEIIKRRITVVICLKNRTFAVSQTSGNQTNRYLSGCDLLEKSYFCSITNIWLWVIALSVPVVICLKNRTFAVSQTSTPFFDVYVNQLWFAWKIVLLQYHKHRKGNRSACTLSCDLLEKSYFCSITNISELDKLFGSLVVICLKNRTFAVSQTSRGFHINQ